MPREAIWHHAFDFTNNTVGVKDLNTNRDFSVHEVDSFIGLNKS